MIKRTVTLDSLDNNCNRNPVYLEKLSGSVDKSSINLQEPSVRMVSQDEQSQQRPKGS